MAQTKRKRRSKHRGTPAGTIETRGRTGRKPRAGEGKNPSKMTAAEKREARLNTAPTWRAAFNRALIATAIFLIASIFLLHVKPAAGIGLMVFVLAIYTVLGYYTDTFMYRRRQRRRST